MIFVHLHPAMNTSNLKPKPKPKLKLGLKLKLKSMSKPKYPQRRPLPQIYPECKTVTSNRITFNNYSKFEFTDCLKISRYYGYTIKILCFEIDKSKKTVIDFTSPNWLFDYPEPCKYRGTITWIPRDITCIVLGKEYDYLISMPKHIEYLRMENYSARFFDETACVHAHGHGHGRAYTHGYVLPKYLKYFKGNIENGILSKNIHIIHLLAESLVHIRRYESRHQFRHKTLEFSKNISIIITNSNHVPDQFSKQFPKQLKYLKICGGTHTIPIVQLDNCSIVQS